MIKSSYIKDILDLIVDGESDEIKLRQQIECLTVNELNHTGVGLYVYFIHTDTALNYRLSSDLVLNGIEINIPSLNINAEATLFTKDGIINYLDILSRDDSYPKEEPSSYIIKQNWVKTNRKQIVKQ